MSFLFIFAGKGHAIGGKLKTNGAIEFSKVYVSENVKYTTYSQLETDHAKLLLQVQELKIKKTKMLSEHTLLKEQILELQKTGKAIDEHRKNLLEENIKLNSKISTKHAVNKQVTSELEELTSKYQELKTNHIPSTKYSQLDSKYKKILDELSTLRKEYSKLELTQQPEAQDAAYNKMLIEQKTNKSVDAQHKKLLAENKTLTTRVSTGHATGDHLKSELDKLASNFQHLKTELSSKQKLHAGLEKKHRFIRRLLWVLLSIIYYLIFAILYHVIFFRVWIALHCIPSARSHKLSSLWENELNHSKEINELPICRSFWDNSSKSYRAMCVCCSWKNTVISESTFGRWGTYLTPVHLLNEWRVVLPQDLVKSRSREIRV